MAMGALQVTVPAVAAVVGLYFVDKIHSNAKEHLDGGCGLSTASLAAKLRDEAKSSAQVPKLAPKFDGLHCFETLVG
ncbi:hypothetical protein Acr_03g0007920 [Actinidia rufa]|uniref:Uncharacterized protein n=1 Tax=Actinidia rufa TaxID=165716 RepID=A0A7J0EC20_9ERIC|nr:hypothetical protein Acr_03g0007920 [Actinidia rufa]